MSGQIEVQLMLIPAVLITIAATLVDATFLTDSFRHRIWAQLPLWLAASLQRAPKDDGSLTYVLIHIVFFLSLSSAGYEAFRIQCRWWTTNSVRTDYSRCLAPSMIVPLLYSFIWLVSPTDMGLAWMQCSGLFSLTFLALCGWRWTVLRKRGFRQEHVGMPTVESLPIFHSTRSLDESLWSEWSPAELLTWIHGLEGDWSSVCSQLASERIPGSVLESLTVGDLRSMGVPYGPSRLLLNKIKDVTDRYPSRQTDRYRDPEHDELEMDHWYKENTCTERVPPQTVVPAKGFQPAMDTCGPFGQPDDEAVQRAKDMFREQFGLELPEIRAPSALKNEQSPDETRESMPEVMGKVTGPVCQVGDDSIPQGLLESMPPHIREVAEERPDLLQMLWKQRQKGKIAPSFGVSKIHELRMQDPAYAARFVGAQAAAEIAGIHVKSNVGNSGDNDEILDQNSDGERTGLLRKRSTRAEYAAIR